MRSLAWTIFLLALFIYVVGVCFTQAVTDHKVTLRSRHNGLLEENYGTLGISMLSLFEAITDGIEWRDIVDPLTDKISPFMVVPFVLYIVFVQFALMNILTGIF